MSVEIVNNFKEIVENVLNRWTALRLAVEHGMGGALGVQTAVEIIQYVTDFCLQNNKVSIEDLEDCLEDIMDQEFDTVCEDNSIKEISFYLIKYLTLLKDGKKDEISQELSKLPPCTKWIFLGNNISIVKTESDEEMSEDDDDSDTPGPSNNEASKKTQEDDFEEEPGWTTIRTRRKK